VGGRGDLDKLPLDGHHSFFCGSNLVEGTLGEINAVPVGARGAVVRNGDSDGLAIVCVDDLDLFAAQGRRIARITVTVLVNSRNEVAVGMDGTAGTWITILEEERGKSTQVEAASVTA